MQKDTKQCVATSRTHSQTQTHMQAVREEEKQHSHPSGDVSPAMRIYRHALESVFAMLNLGDLSRVLAVSREWAAAVRSMKPVNARIERDKNERGLIRERRAFRPLPPIASIVGSPLLRHLAAIEVSDVAAYWTLLTNESLGLLVRHAPNLQSLRCALQITSNEPLVMPAKLTLLHLQLHSEFKDAQINVVLATVAALPSLSRLHLKCSAFEHPNLVQLSILAACRSLSALTLETYPGSNPKLSDTQVDQIRSSFGHLSHFSLGPWMASDELARLLQPPVTARWQDIGFVWGGERTAELLVTLKTITKLDLTYCHGPAPVEFLPQLPLLLSLYLDCEKYSGGETWYLPADAMLASVMRCTGLTSLNLGCGLNSALWSALFGKLTNSSS